MKELLVSIFCFLLLSCGGSGNDSVETERISDSPAVPVNDITPEAEQFVDSLMATLTLEERVGQCLMPSIYTSSDSATLRLFRRYIDDFHVGGVVLMQGSLESAKQLSGISEISPVPLFMAIDAEWGLGMRLSDAPVFPKNGNFPEGTDELVMFDYGTEIAEECHKAGINMVLGPVVDIVGSGSNVIGKRSFGSNPDMVANFGVAYSRGLESGGVVSVAKHFPGHGSAVNDSHRGVARVDKNVSAIDSIDLRPFREYINSGLSGIMAGHIQADALDPEGKAASVSMAMLTSLLRKEMGFQGLILTDAFDMGGAKGFSAAEAIEAGADIILCPNDLEREYHDVLVKVRQGDLDMKTLDDRCRRILFIKYLFGLFK